MADQATGSSSGLGNSGDFPQPSALIEAGQSGLPERCRVSLVAQLSVPPISFRVAATPGDL
jgi:hypothetical protein